MGRVIQGDCLEVMPTLPTASVDMILADLPYGTTRNKWDSVIPLELLWVEYKRLLKPAGAVVLDNVAGSGTPAIAALRTGRDYILIEKEPEYIAIINNRIAQEEATRCA